MSIINKANVLNFIGIKPKRDYSISDRRATAGALAILATQLTDFGSTVTGIHLGLLREANGAMAQVIEAYGFTGFLAVKLLGAAFLIWVTFRRRFAPWLVTGLYAGISIWNLSLLAWALNQ
jgi:hypothetical protein